MGSDVGLMIRRSVSPGGRADQILDWFYLNLWHLDSELWPAVLLSHGEVDPHVVAAPNLRLPHTLSLPGGHRGGYYQSCWDNWHFFLI